MTTQHSDPSTGGNLTTSPGTPSASPSTQSTATPSGHLRSSSDSSTSIELSRNKKPLRLSIERAEVLATHYFKKLRSHHQRIAELSTADPTYADDTIACYIDQFVGKFEPDVIDACKRILNNRDPNKRGYPDVAEWVEMFRAFKAPDSERERQASDWDKAVPINTGGAGIAGWVEHATKANKGNEVALRELAKIREILARPPAQNDAERKQRLERAVKEHEALLDRQTRDGVFGYGTRHNPEHKCAHPGCRRWGTRTNATLGATQWFCKEHIKQ